MANSSQDELIEGELGRMVIHMDGSIIESSGELLNNQETAQAIAQMIFYSFQMELNPLPITEEESSTSTSGNNGPQGKEKEPQQVVTSPLSTESPGSPSPRIRMGVTALKKSVASLSLLQQLPISSTDKADEQELLKWHRLIVDFHTHSYTTCISNEKIHIIKRKNLSASDFPRKLELLSERDARHLESSEDSGSSKFSKSSVDTVIKRASPFGSSPEPDDVISEPQEKDPNTPTLILVTPPPPPDHDVSDSESSVLLSSGTLSAAGSPSQKSGLDLSATDSLPISISGSSATSDSGDESPSPLFLSPTHSRSESESDLGRNFYTPGVSDSESGSPAAFGTPADSRASSKFDLS